jgi:hypothetical protein
MDKVRLEIPDDESGNPFLNLGTLLLDRKIAIEIRAVPA